MEDLQDETKQCPYCAETIKAKAIVCRYCGRDLVPESERPLANAAPAKATVRASGGCIASFFKLVFWGALFLVFIVGVGSIAALLADLGGTPTAANHPTTPTLTVNQIKEQAKEISYEDLARNTEDYVGSIVHYTGEVVQVSELSGTRAILRVNVTKGDYGFWTDTIWVNYDGPRLLEDDIIEIWGLVEGRRTYTAVLGNEITIPEITSLVVERK